MVRLCGASLGLFAFCVAIVEGLLAGNPVEVVLIRAVWALACFCVLGLVTGWTAHRVLEERDRSVYRRMSPEGAQQEGAADRSAGSTAEGADLAGTEPAAPG